MMKSGAKILFMLMFLTGINYHVMGQQNYIYNYDFESYSICPDNMGQADRCLAFFSLIENADYSNCSFKVTDFYPSAPGAYSGLGYMSMASYGNLNGSAEAIAQNLPVPLTAGVAYDFHVVTKRAASGQFTNNCGGFYLYGFDNPVSGPNWNICVSSLPGATLLGFTDTIKEINWTSKGFTFVAPFTVKAIAFSPACASGCFQAIFLDSVSISLEVVGINNLSKENINIFPVPVADELIIHMENNQNSPVEIFNAKGKLIYKGIIDSNENKIDTRGWNNGIYFIKINSGENMISKKLIVQH